MSHIALCDSWSQGSTRSHRPLTVYRLVRGIVCLITLVSTAFVFLVMLAPPIFVIVRFFAVHTSRKLAAVIFGQWLALWPYLFEKINGTNVIFSGHKVPYGERVMVMCNHRTEVDWMYIWNLALRKGRIGSCKYAMKSSVRNVPIFGWAFHVMEFLLLDRNWEHDQPVIESYLKSFRNPCDPFWFVLFPEGTDFTEQKLIKGNNYAKELGLPGTLRHVLLPRTRGFVACVPIVHRSLDAVYDLTIAYKYRCPLFIDNLFGIDPAEVHINIQRIPMEELPTSEEEASSWLYDRFYQKDQLLTEFDKDQCFPDRIDEGELDTRAFLLRLGGYIVITILVLRRPWESFFDGPRQILSSATPSGIWKGGAVVLVYRLNMSNFGFLL
ncbi:unnamed protein product [Calypogeia fissa]